MLRRMKFLPPLMRSPRRHLLAGWVVCAGLLAGAHAAPPAPPLTASPPVSPIHASVFRDWPDAFRLHNDQAEAVLVPALGRLVHFAALGKDSPLRLDPRLAGRTPSVADRFFNIGGDWLWPVAQARWASLTADGRDWPPPPVLADGPWTCSAWTDADGAPCALLSREFGDPLHIQVSRLFRLEPGQASLSVRQRIERIQPSDIPVVLWNVSQIANAEHVAMPVDASSKFRGGLKSLMGKKPAQNQLGNCGDVAVYRVADGTETKLGSDSPRGWIAAAKENLVIFESIRNTAQGAFPDGGCVVELYSNHGLGYSEIETLSPEVHLAPGQVLENMLTLSLVSTESPLAECPLADFIRNVAGEAPAATALAIR